MSEVSDYIWRELEDTFPWPDDEYQVIGMALIEGVIDGQKWAATVPITLAQDEPAAHAYLKYLARERR